MSAWKYAPIGLVFGAFVWIAEPDILKTKAVPSSDQEVHAPVTEVQASSPSRPPRAPGQAVASLEKRRSDVDKIDWYIPRSANQIRSTIAVYIGDDGQTPQLRMIVSRSSSTKFLIPTSVVIVAGDSRITLDGRFESEALPDGSVAEILEISVPESKSSFLETLGKNGGAIKILGHNGADERKITLEEQQDISLVISAYRELGGI